MRLSKSLCHPTPIIISLGFIIGFIYFSPSFSPDIALPQALNGSTYSSFVLSPESPQLAYRHSLSKPTHSPTLGFSKILVLSFPTRTERRERMNKIARAMGMEIEFVDAWNRTESVIEWIGERVVDGRRLRRERMAKERKVKASSIGGLQLGNDWIFPSLSRSAKTPLPPYPVSPPWTTTLHQALTTSTLSSLVPSSPGLNLTDVLIDPLEPSDSKRQLNPGIISTFLGHLNVVNKIVESDWETTLVLEDDVDLEWDLEYMWQTMKRRLPKGDGWDMVFLGQCWGHEVGRQSPHLHPLLRPSVSPMCLHAYALSHSGATTLLKELLNPWSAFQTTIDSYVPSLIGFEKLRSFSVEPAIVIQRKDMGSDIQPLGVGSRWRGYLRDSTVDRILIDENGGRRDGLALMDEEVWQPDLHDYQRDPATRWREVNLCEVERLKEKERLRVESKKEKEKGGR